MFHGVRCVERPLGDAATVLRRRRAMSLDRLLDGQGSSHWSRGCLASSQTLFRWCQFRIHPEWRTVSPRVPKMGVAVASRTSWGQAEQVAVAREPEQGVAEPRLLEMGVAVASRTSWGQAEQVAVA